MYVLAHGDTCRGQRLTSWCSLQLLIHLNFWDRASCWTCDFTSSWPGSLLSLSILPQAPPQCWGNRSPGVELRPLCLCSKNLIHRTILPLTISLKHGLCWFPNIPSAVTSYTLTVSYYTVSKTLLLKRIKQKHLKFQITFTKYKTDFIN